MRYSSLADRIGGRGAGAWAVHDLAAKQARAGRDIIFLTVGEPDFETPEVVVEAAVRAMRGGDTHYTEVIGRRPLRAAIAAWHRETTGQAVDPDQVTVAAGAQSALFSAMLVCVEPGSEVIRFDPRYSTYEAVVGAAGATPVSVPLLPERGFHPDLDALARAVTPKTRAILMNSPHNPTGAVLREEEVAAIVELAHRHDLWIISDEVYAALCYERSHVSPAAIPGAAERSVVVSSLSKSHAMTGWRVGWIVGPQELAQHLGKLMLCMLYGSPGFIQEAAVAALEEAGGAVAAMREVYRERRDLVAPWLDRLPGLSCRLPEGGMFAMADVRATGLSADAYARRLLEEEGVALLPGDGFGEQAEGFLRLSLGLPAEQLAEACRRIETFQTRLSGGSARRARG